MVEIVQAVAQSAAESAGKVKPPELAGQRNCFFGSRRADGNELSNPTGLPQRG